MVETFRQHKIAKMPSPIRPLARWVLRIGRSLRHALLIVEVFGLSNFVVRSANVARELQAVQSGMKEFENAHGLQDGADYVLRRNTHRLEKGLISRPRRGVFARDYVEETVERLVAGMERTGSIEDGSELAWSRDVLRRLFSVTGSSPEIDRARAMFDAAFHQTAIDDESCLIPYTRNLDLAPSVEYKALLDLSKRRRSVRWFDQRAVPRELIDAAIVVAAQAPSACNRQPFEFYVFDDPKRVKQVATIAPGTVGFADNFPVIVAVVGKLNAFFSDRDRHIIYIDGSLAAMSFMLALETLGLSSCAINTPGDEVMEQRLSDELGLAPYERPIMLIALGHPDHTGSVPRSQKKALDGLRRYNP